MLDLSQSSGEVEPSGLIVVGGYNMDYVTEVPLLFQNPQSIGVMTNYIQYGLCHRGVLHIPISALVKMYQLVQVEQVGRCKGLPKMERMGEGRTRAVTG